MCRKTCARRRKRPTPTTIRRANGAIGARGSGASGILSRHPKRETPHHSPKAEGSISEPFDKLRANGFWDYEFPFSVRAVARFLVRAPPAKLRGVAKAISLHVVVSDFDDQLGAQRLPRQILASAPAALRAGHALPVIAVRRSQIGRASCRG